MYKRILILFLFAGFICRPPVYAQNGAITEFAPNAGIVYDMCFSKDSSRLAITEGKKINVYDVKSKQLVYSLEGGHTKDILSIDISPDDSTLISGGQDGNVIIWDLKTHQVEQKLSYHKGVVTCVKFSPNQKEIASASSDKTVVIYNTQTNKITSQFTFHQKDVNTIAFNSTGDVLASGGDDKLVFLTDTKTGKSIARLNENKGLVRSVKFSSDDMRLISCDDNSNVVVWKTDLLNNIKVVKNSKAGIDWLLSADIYHDSETIVTGSISGKVTVISFFGNNKFDLKVPVQKVLFIPYDGGVIKVAAATRGKGVLLIDTSK